MSLRGGIFLKPNSNRKNTEVQTYTNRGQITACDDEQQAQQHEQMQDTPASVIYDMDQMNFSLQIDLVRWNGKLCSFQNELGKGSNL